jgi:hypothetical protein
VARANNALAIVPKNEPFSAELKAYLYEIWLFLADRSAPRTLKILEQQLSASAPIDTSVDFSRLPSVRTLQSWIKDEKWDEEANDHIRRTAKHIDESQISRMFLISDLALSFAHQLLEHGFDPGDNAGILAVKWDAAKEMLKFRGLGTAGAIGGTPTLEIKVTNTAADLPELTTAEKSEAFRERTLRQKQEKRLTGHTPKS